MALFGLGVFPRISPFCAVGGGGVTGGSLSPPVKLRFKLCLTGAALRRNLTGPKRTSEGSHVLLWFQMVENCGDGKV